MQSITAPALTDGTVLSGRFSANALKAIASDSSLKFLAAQGTALGDGGRALSDTVAVTDVVGEGEPDAVSVPELVPDMDEDSVFVAVGVCELVAVPVGVTEVVGDPVLDGVRVPVGVTEVVGDSVLEGVGEPVVVAVSVTVPDTEPVACGVGVKDGVDCGVVDGVTDAMKVPVTVGELVADAMREDDSASTRIVCVVSVNLCYKHKIYYFNVLWNQVTTLLQLLLRNKDCVI